MGIPIWRDDSEPLKTVKGYFSARVTDNVVGAEPDTVFDQQPQCHRLLFPVLSFDGCVVNESWSGSCLQFVCGGLGEGGVFYRVLPGRKLSYLGTVMHPSAGHLGFSPPMRMLVSALLTGPLRRRLERPVHPGFVDFVEWSPGQSESDEEGYSHAPVVYLGGDADDVLLGSDRVPCCVECARKMRYVGELSCGAFAEDLFDIPISLFYCHDCGVQCCVDDVDVVLLSD